MRKRELIELAQRLARNQDTTLPHLLGVQRNRVTNWKNQEPIPDAYAVRIAEILDRDPALTLVELHAENAKDPKALATWLDLCQRLQTLKKGLVAIAHNVYRVNLPFGRTGSSRKAS